ncbi:MAG: mechanosensitive ion channel, partial [Chroococcidiopsidaceae cyanobacterium CP_BM_RX_35]|nr:mechanosensitive ion channel [Chroococcidiopsidaceae cyanobacterium CP_BM_RX_35]
FLSQFKDYPEEKSQPGYFTDGIITTAPVIFDILGEESQAFKSEFRQKYGTEPTYVGALYYDTAKVLVAAMQQAGVQGNPANIADERRQIRNALAGINSKGKAITGIAGPIYFDQEHNAVRPVAIGILEQQQLVSAFIQLTPILSLQNQPELEQEVRADDVVALGEQYLYKTNIVPTGIEVNQISNLNLEDKTCTLDFDIWFRHQNQGQVIEEVKKVEFLNALEPVELKKPLVEKKIDNIFYQLYKVKGKFQVDFLPERRFGEHTLGISFINQDINHNNLVYVIDVVGLGEREGLQHREQEPWHRLEILSPATGWKLNQTLFFQDLVTKDAQGNPKSLSAKEQQAKFSRFNLELTITKNEINFRRIMPVPIATYLAIGSSIILGFIFVLGKFNWLKLPTQWSWILQASSVLLFLWSIEAVLISWLGQRELGSGVMQLAVMGFSILWWLVPCFILNLAIQDFIWATLEKSTRQNVPTLLRRLVSVVIYLFAVFGIVAYVFHQPITSLLGASGLFLTIIGLAIQINISNVFSGLAINLEKAVRVGDYIELPEKKIIGYVHDINWRATRIRTISGNIVLVPNSEINNQTIINYALPDKLSNADIVFCLEHKVSPEQATAVLLEAVKVVCDMGVNSPLSQPEPCVLVSDITLDGVEYWVRCWFVAGETTLSLIKNVVTRSVLEHLQRAEIKLAESNVTILRENSP